MKVNGFTLIELLAAMVVGSLLLALLSWVVSTLGRETGKATNLGPEREVHAMRPILTALIESARNDVDHPIQVSKSQVSMETTPPMAMGPVGAVDLVLTTEEEAGQRRLNGKFTTKPSDGGGVEKTFRSAAQWDDISFSAIQQPSPPSSLKSPIAAVRITFQKGLEREEIIALPRINMPQNCVFDPISMTCRQ